MLHDRKSDSLDRDSSMEKAWLYEKGPSKQITLDIFRRLTRLVRKSKEVMFNENEIHLAQRLFRFQEFHSVKFFVKDR